jgi:hypothetical protein
MPQNKRKRQMRILAVYYVQITVAHASTLHPNKYFLSARLRVRSFLDY